MGSFRKYLQKNGYASKTIESNERMVYSFLSWLDQFNSQLEVEQVKHVDLLAYIKHLQQKKLEQSSIQAYVNALKLFYAFKMNVGTVVTNPVTGIAIKGVKRQKLYHLFTSEELHSLYSNYHGDDLRIKRNKVMLGLYVYQGIQTSELARLELNNIDLRVGEIKVPGTKRSNERTLKLEAVQILDLMEYLTQIRNEILKLSGEETQILFVGIKGGRDVTNYVNQLMNQLKQQNKEVKNAQQLRASVIVKWLRQYNLREVQHRAGHKYISSTEAFKVNDMESLQEDINRFHPIG